MFKRNLLLFTVFVLLSGSLFADRAAAQSSTPEETVKEFYTWFLNDQAAARENPAKLKSFVTMKLFAKARKIEATGDGSYYTGEAAGITVSPGTVRVLDVKTGKTSSKVTVLLKSSKDYSDEPDIVTEVKLALTVVKGRAGWKIDNVEIL